MKLAKLTLEQRISKVEDAITNEELLIEASKEKIKKFKAELKTLVAEKEQSFANEVLRLVKEKGINPDAFLSSLKDVSATEDVNLTSPNDTEKQGAFQQNTSTFSDIQSAVT